MPSINEETFTPNNVWGSTTPTGVEEDLTLPSGQTCRAKKLSIEGMIEAGVLADADVLTATVNKHVRKVKGGNKKADGTEVNSMALLKDPQAMKALNGMLCRAVPHIVTSPSVKMHYEEVTIGKTTVVKTIAPEDREDGVIYTDQVDFTDKMFLFDWAAGGFQAMLAFRG